MRWTRGFIGTAALVLSGLATVNAQGREQDPSSRVLRASYLQGEVSFRPGNVDDWTSATLNYPLSSGDHLWTDANARAELHVGSNAIRLAPETAFEILDLDDNHLQIRLTQGSALIRIRTLDADDNVEIDTPTGAVTLMRDGTYRIDVSADGATSTVTTRNGDAEVTANDNTVSVRPDETVLFTVDGASPDVRDAAPMDEYDQWSYSRDRAEDESVSAQYVSRDMTGYEDLDRNGTWSDDADYGHVWVPSHVAYDWAPYRYGRWAWVEPYGWTWIDDAPWGFAPFHYGRWAYVRERWVWAPGVVRRRPVYAPALVVFVGGSNFSGGGYYGDRGDVAWFPLAPREIYRPAYRTSDDYVRRVNVTNVNVTNINITNVNVTNIQYRNQRVQGATTAVSQDQFAGSRRIGRTAVVVPVSEARSAHVVGDGAPVTPTQQSVLIRRQGATQVSRPPEASQTRQVVWKNTPPPRPATFASHAAQLQTTGDKPVAPLTISQTRGAPRSGVTRGMSHTDGNAQVNRAPNSAPTHTVVPTAVAPTPVTPSTTARPVPNTRPNINVRSYPNDESRPAPAPQPNVNVRPAPAAQPNENARPVPAPQPNVNVRSAPAAQPRANDRPVSHTDGPSPVNGSANGSPAHTVAEPNPNSHPSPNAHAATPPNTRAAPRQEEQAPRAAPQDERKSPAQGEKPEAPQATKAPPARGQSDKGAASDKRRAPTNDKENTKPPARDDKPPRRN
ncbi:MAG TPA: DUF6600 domain-containing protein [Gemmatimonadaceae bacterium]